MTRSDPDTYFSELIFPLTREEFFRDYFEEKHVRLGGDDPGRFSHFFSFRELEALFKVGAVYNQYSVSMNFRGNDIARHSFCDESQNIDFDKVIRNYEGGATIVARGLQFVNNFILHLCRGLEAVLGHKVHVNLYATPANSQGFDVHYDSHDVFVAQLEGRKEWKFYDFPVKYFHKEMPRTVSPDLSEGPSDELVLEAGELLYVPRGESHGACCFPGDQSVHLTIGMNGFSSTNLLVEAIKAIDSREESFRKGLTASILDPDCPHEELDRQMQEMLTGAMDRLSSKAAGEHLRKRDPFRGNHFSEISLPKKGAWERLGPNTELRVVDSSQLQCDGKGYHVLLHLPYRSAPLCLRSKFKDAATYLAGKKTIAPGEIPGIADGEEAKLFCYHLLMNGVLFEV